MPILACKDVVVMILDNNSSPDSQVITRSEYRNVCLLLYLNGPTNYSFDELGAACTVMDPQNC
jgi:hypothetical protein